MVRLRVHVRILMSKIKLAKILDTLILRRFMAQVHAHAQRFTITQQVKVKSVRLAIS